MATFTLGIHNFDESTGYSTAISQNEDGTETRRSLNTNSHSTFDCTSPVLTETEIDDYRAFYDARKGEFESFTWDTKTVRFQGPMNIKHHFDGWQATWTFKVVN